MTQVEFASFEWAGRRVRIEYEWLGSEHNQPIILFLHEGLGSRALWKDFPSRLCDAVGARGLVYSRPGYGSSSACSGAAKWEPDFIHRQALEVLPAFLQALGVDGRPWLFGHSDGASIALLYAARRPRSVSGLVLLAPHIFVEPCTLANIRKVREDFLTTNFRERLARYHDNVDSTFWGWNDAWLNPAFASWTIENELSSVSCPVLAIQGVDDEYGTLAQIHGIARRVDRARILELSRCGHSPHRDQPLSVIEATRSFLARSECSTHPSVAP